MRALLFLFLSIILLKAEKPPKYATFEIVNYSSTSHELVYDPDSNKKLSELIWKVDDVPLFGVGLKLFSRYNSIINLSFHKHLTQEKALMDDYDWLKNDRTEWSDWSNHPNTKINNISIFDMNWQYNFKQKKLGSYYSTYFGFRYLEHDFAAYDGSYIYSSSSGFRDKTGTFNGLGISYYEKFQSVYFKAEMKKYFKKFILKGSVTYAPYVNAMNEDNHHDRSFINRNNFDNGSMYGYGLNLLYEINKKIYLGLYYNYYKYSEMKGTTTRTYYENNPSEGASKGDTLVYGGAGISNESNYYSNIKLYIKF